LIFNDVTATIGGRTYLFEDLARLEAEGDTDKVALANASLALLCRYMPTRYPGFIPCAGGLPPELNEYLSEENEKVRKDVASGKPLPTEEEWKDRIRAKQEAILASHRRDLDEITFRVSSGRNHVGSLYLSEVQIEGEVRGVSQLAAQVTCAFDIGENDNDAWQALGTEFGIYLLRNTFFSPVDDPRTFQLKAFRLPDIYQGLLDSSVNAAAVAMIQAEGIVYDTYPNTPRQDAMGIIKLRDMRLA